MKTLIAGVAIGAALAGGGSVAYAAINSTNTTHAAVARIHIAPPDGRARPVNHPDMVPRAAPVVVAPVAHAQTQPSAPAQQAAPAQPQQPQQGGACTTVSGLYPGGEPGHIIPDGTPTGFCQPNGVAPENSGQPTAPAQPGQTPPPTIPPGGGTNTCVQYNDCAPLQPGQVPAPGQTG